MTSILFVCLGNICRSAMAEAMMKYKLEERGISDNYFIDSAGTSDEEEGNLMYSPARRLLLQKHIPVGDHQARKIRKSDYSRFDLIIGMDDSNIRNLKWFFNGDKKNKIRKMMNYCGSNKNVADPWYTGNFVETYADLDEALDKLIDSLEM